MDRLIQIIENTLRFVVERVHRERPRQVEQLGGNIRKLESNIAKPFHRLTWDEACDLLHLGKEVGRREKLDFNLREERAIMKHFDDHPVFVIRHPAELKFFNSKRATKDARCLSADLLLAPLGETVGAAIREERAIN